MSFRHEAGVMPWDRTGNRLLVRSQLGTNKPTNYDIPGSQFVYGQSTPQDPEQAVDLIYKWKTHINSANPNIGKEKDLIETNKKALKQLLHTSNQFQTYRKANTLFKKPKEGSNVIAISLPQEGHAYGKPLELEDPIRLVMANEYGELDKITRQTFYEGQNQALSSQKRKLSCHITKNYHLKKEATSKRMSQFDWNKKDPQWKLSKFQGVGYKVDTRRPRAQSTQL